LARISRLNESLGSDRTGLVLFDVLQGYLHPSDPAKVRFLEEQGILANLQRLLRGARQAGLTVFYPTGAHAPDGADSVARLTDTDMDMAPLGSGRSVKPRFHRGSPEAEIAAELAPAEGDVRIPKQRWSAFFQTNLELQLRVRGIETIVIAGGSTDVGIASTVYVARDLDYGLVVVRDACFSMRGNNHEFFMDRVFPRMGRVRSVSETLALMAPAGPQVPPSEENR
jgi:ureidoacrylate peracid hydrolase